jgi:uncharacterized Ntn-hydrolase superfamily protein
MLVVRKRGGRNINNDRYVYINVDDAPDPFPELRRLLDMNLGLLYQEKISTTLDAADTKGAFDAAQKVARYMPRNVQAHMILGLLDYMNSDKKSAAAELIKARELDPENFRRRLNQAAQRPVFRSIAQDQEFLKTLN